VYKVNTIQVYISELGKKKGGLLFIVTIQVILILQRCDSLFLFYFAGFFVVGAEVGTYVVTEDVTEGISVMLVTSDINVS
jgi:hypothetical protein